MLSIIKIRPFNQMKFNINIIKKHQVKRITFVKLCCRLECKQKQATTFITLEI